ncbi:MAG: pyridoxamine 5'-phosphate oxidase family protein [Chloroflexi bacterium]|nr:MAG: pyridoxamine 5'-phosphate oxidase family protein [Chloroflexota bacterium]
MGRRDARGDRGAVRSRGPRGRSDRPGAPPGPDVALRAGAHDARAGPLRRLVREGRGPGERGAAPRRGRAQDGRRARVDRRDVSRARRARAGRHPRFQDDGRERGARARAPGAAGGADRGPAPRLRRLVAVARRPPQLRRTPHGGARARRAPHAARVREPQARAHGRCARGRRVRHALRCRGHRRVRGRDVRGGDRPGAAPRAGGGPLARWTERHRADRPRRRPARAPGPAPRRGDARLREGRVSEDGLAALQVLIDRSVRTATPAVADSVAYPERQMTAAELVDFVRQARMIAMATVGPTGQPHIAPVHAELDGTTLRLVVYENTVRRQDIVKNPRVGFTTWKDGAVAILYGRAREVAGSLAEARPGRSGRKRRVVTLLVRLTRVYAMRAPGA